MRGRELQKSRAPKVWRLYAEAEPRETPRMKLHGEGAVEEQKGRAPIEDSYQAQV